MHQRYLLPAVFAAIASIVLLLGSQAAGQRPKKDAEIPEKAAAGARMRHPVALAQTKDGKWLFVANQRSGTISVIDTAAMRPVAECAVGRKLAGLAIMPDDTGLIAVDEEAAELIVLDRHDSTLRPRVRLKVSAAPVSVQLSTDGSRCA